MECASFIEDMDKIAENPYVDSFILGLADLSGSMNETGDFFGENNLKLAKRAIEIAKKHHKMIGVALLATDEETLTGLHEMGRKKNI